jgi:hypothetical protein
VSLQHIVLFSFPADLSSADDEEMRRQIEAWPAEIGGMTSIRFGRSINEERTRGYQYLLYTEFPDVATLVTYQKHPVHQKFLHWVMDRDCTPLAFDYPLDATTVVLETPAATRA